MIKRSSTPKGTDDRTQDRSLPAEGDSIQPTGSSKKFRDNIDQRAHTPLQETNPAAAGIARRSKTTPRK